MNALLEDDFPRDRIEGALTAIARTVAEGGLLVLGGNSERERVAATIFVRTQGRFSVLSEMSDGYSLKGFVTGLHL